MIEPSCPLVGLTQRVCISEHAERRDALDQRWHKLAAALGFLPLALPNNPAWALAYVNQLQPRGLILTGGNDLAHYGGDAPERDLTEVALLEYARQRRLPVLGVCRGMQLMLCHDGARLAPVHGHVCPRMTVSIDGDDAQVNSYHRQQVEAPSDAWRVFARAPDGVIKAAVHHDLPWTTIMWHPERDPHLQPHDERLIRQLFRLEEDHRCAV